METGWLHREISDAAFRQQQGVDDGRLPIVGVNCFQLEDEELPVEIFETPEALPVQEAKLEKFRKERDRKATQRALDTVARVCDEGGNLMDTMVEAVAAPVTLGEISATIKKTFGTWQMPLF